MLSCLQLHVDVRDCLGPIGMLATLQSDWISCVQRDSGLFSWSRTLSRERSVGARRRACPTQRRRFWRNSANSGGASVSRRTRSRVACSSGVLVTIRRKRRKRTPSRWTASVFEIGHTSALKHITDRTSAQYRRPFTSVAMDDERHRVLRESNTAHAMPQCRLTSGVAEQVGSICMPRYTNSPKDRKIWVQSASACTGHGDELRITNNGNELWERLCSCPALDDNQSFITPKHHMKDIHKNNTTLAKCQLNAYLHRIGKHPDGLCYSCNKPETVTHFLTECPQNRTCSAVLAACNNRTFW